jgi:hypothetical protein
MDSINIKRCKEIERNRLPHIEAGSGGKNGGEEGFLSE